jgi:hypothetical protein
MKLNPNGFCLRGLKNKTFFVLSLHSAACFISLDRLFWSVIIIALACSQVEQRFPEFIFTLLSRECEPQHLLEIATGESKNLAGGSSTKKTFPD